MKIYAGVTDNAWFNFLKKLEPRPIDINFWQPGGNSMFKVLKPGEPFLFKVKRPFNHIAGVGFFVRHTILPLNFAWDTFKESNGCADLGSFKKSILSYRSDKINTNPNIGCIVLSNPVFFDQKDWIPVPADWANSIVQGKSYETATETGGEIWKRVRELLPLYQKTLSVVEPAHIGDLVQEYGQPAYQLAMTKMRIGQAAFRVVVTDAYKRKCAISGEKTLPVLEAAHIRSYTEAGPNIVSNGLLLRADMHKLFDSFYITITPDYRVEVSSRIREEFENGKEYYKFHGQPLLILPEQLAERPNASFIDWHNNSFKS